MLSKTPSAPARSPAPGVIPKAITAPVSNGSSAATAPDLTPSETISTPSVG